MTLFGRIEAVFTPELVHAKSGFGDPSSLAIFVLGMLRSGTTLIEQILASHPQVHRAGELKAFESVVTAVEGPDGRAIPLPDFVAGLDAPALKAIGARCVARVRKLAPAAARVTDKMPSIWIPLMQSCSLTWRKLRRAVRITSIWLRLSCGPILVRGTN
jgi:hypothetical protein